MPRNKKYWKDSFGPLATVAYHEDFDVRNIPDLNDDGLAYLLTHVKGINVLNLSETEITNASIALLATLEYIKKLCIKGIDDITNECVPDLNKIKGLEILHVKNTNITIDGLLKLTNQHQLKKIFFSANDVESIKEKLMQLKQMHPDCDFIINGIPYKVDVVAYLNFIFKERCFFYRMKIKNEPLTQQWSAWLTNPSSNYYEAENQGVYAIKDVEWIEIDAVEKIKEGRLIDTKQIDHSAEVIKVLEALQVPMMVVDGVVSLYL